MSEVNTSAGSPDNVTRKNRKAAGAPGRAWLHPQQKKALPAITTSYEKQALHRAPQRNHAERCMAANQTQERAPAATRQMLPPRIQVSEEELQQQGERHE